MYSPKLLFIIWLFVIYLRHNSSVFLFPYLSAFPMQDFLACPGPIC